MASTRLERTNGTETTRTKCTFSAWFKYDQTSGTNTIVACSDDSGANTYFQVELKPDIDVQIRDGSSATYLARRSNAKLRDASGWYHLVITFDSTDGTADDRLKIFLNGERITSFSDNTGTVDSNYNCPLFKSSIPIKIGSGNNNNNYFSGAISHIHATDGYAYDASAFGETDSNGVWKIKTSPSVTYGDNGFFILKNGNSVTDQSGEGNNFTVAAGTLTDLQDNPSDVFATFNPLMALNSTISLANCNTKATTPSSYETGRSNSIFSTLGMSKGKFYTEFKAVTTPAANALIGVGFDLSSAQQGTATNQYNFSFTNLGFSYNSVGSIGNDGDGWTSTGYDTYTANDIIGVAIDCDNNKLYVSKNGTWQNSANPSSGTGGFSITADKEYFFAVADNAAAEVYVYQANFGNGYFGTSAISSEGTNASGIGKFEYDVPTNYTALCTKGLNS